MVHSQSVRLTYLNVANGSLKSGPDTYSAYSGVIRGIRTIEREYAGQKTTKLELLMENPGCDDERFARVIISGTLFKADGTVTVWGRMLLARLVGNNLAPDQVLTISHYPAGETHGTCAKVTEGFDPFGPALKGVDFKAEQPAECARIAHAALVRLMQWYGTFGAHHEPMEDEIPDEEPQQPSHRERPQPPARHTTQQMTTGQQRPAPSAQAQQPAPERVIGADDDLPF